MAIDNSQPITLKEHLEAADAPTIAKFNRIQAEFARRRAARRKAREQREEK